MVKVWMRDDPGRRTRFHRDPTCRQLRKGPALGQHWELKQVELTEAAGRPCLTCYPDAPRIKIHKRYCEVCESVRPCEHNGGIKMISRDGRRFWAWPDSNLMPYLRRQARQESA